MKIHVINGPNLNLLGIREPEIYGSLSFDKVSEDLQKQFASIEILYFQSNHEGAIIDYIHQILIAHLQETTIPIGVVINPGSLGHYSYALHDALLTLNCPKVEVHISNVAQRESFRHTSVITRACNGIISGLGIRGYHLAVQWLYDERQTNKTS